MPAVTVADITVLPRVPLADAAVARQRPVRSVTTAPRGFEGEGFPVRHYCSLRTPSRYDKDLVWTYPEPFHDAEAVRDLLCFPQDRVDVQVDAEAEAEMRRTS